MGGFILAGLMWIPGQTWALSKTASRTRLTKSSVLLAGGSASRSSGAVRRFDGARTSGSWKFTGGVLVRILNMSYKLSLDSGASCREDGAELFHGCLCSCRPLLHSQKHHCPFHCFPLWKIIKLGIWGIPHVTSGGGGTLAKDGAQMA
jgi:hypothetical protein